MNEKFCHHSREVLNSLATFATLLYIILSVLPVQSTSQQNLLVILIVFNSVLVIELKNIEMNHISTIFLLLFFLVINSATLRKGLQTVNPLILKMKTMEVMMSMKKNVMEMQMRQP